jgi:hypothetical protein
VTKTCPGQGGEVIAARHWSDQQGACHPVSVHVRGEVDVSALAPVWVVRPGRPGDAGQRVRGGVHPLGRGRLQGQQALEPGLASHAGGFQALDSGLPRAESALGAPSTVVDVQCAVIRPVGRGQQQWLVVRG